MIGIPTLWAATGRFWRPNHAAFGPERAVAPQYWSPHTGLSVRTGKGRQFRRPITNFYSYIMVRPSGGNWSNPLTVRDMLGLLPHFTFQIRLTRCIRSLPVRRTFRVMRKALAFVIAMVFAAKCCVASSNDVALNFRSGALAGFLRDWDEQRSSDVSMRVSWTRRLGHEYLHCQLTNKSEHPIILNRPLLPWNAWVAIGFFVFDAEGRALWSPGPGSFPMPPPEPLTLRAGQSIEGDIDFVKEPFYELASRDDLFLLWRAGATTYRESTEDRSAGTSRKPPELSMSGITYVPRRQPPKRQ